MSKFYKIYLSVVGAFLVLLVIGSVILTTVLSSYESSVPKNVAERYFNDYVLTYNFAALRGEDSEFESADVINAACKEKYEGRELTLIAAKSATDGSQGYIVKCGDERVLSFSVDKSGEKTAYGFEKYKIGKVSFAFTDDINIRAPENCTVYLNGKALGEAQKHEVKEEGEKIKLPDGLTPIKYVSYKVDGIVAEPSVTASTADGSSLPVSYSETAKLYEIKLGSDSALSDKYTEYVITATKNYATYMADDGYFGMITKYFEPGTDTYNYIKDTSVSFVWDHDSYTFTDTWAGEFVEYSDTVFTCRVKMTQNLFLRNKEPYHDYIDLTLTMHKTGDTYLVYNIKNNG